MKFVKSAAIAGILIIMAGLSGFNLLHSAETILIGQAEMERVFNEYQGTKDFQEEIAGIQEDFQRAQQEGDQQKLMEIQQNFQIMQNQLIENFQAAIKEASAPVSERMNVHIIVAEVLYHSDSAQIVDVSDELIEEMK